MNFLKKIRLLFFLFLFLFSCNESGTTEQKIDPNTYFEGEIKLSESRGLYGSFFEVQSTYLISENSLKRQQKLGGINSPLDCIAGIIIDLKKDQVILYSADKISGKRKHTMSIKAYKNFLKEESFPNSVPSPVDNTFKLISNRQTILHIKDSAVVKGFKSDYTLYKDPSEILQQEVFDSKKIKIKRDLLEMVFMNLPKEINFLLSSDIKTGISVDSLISGQQTKALDEFARNFAKRDSSPAEKTDLETLAKNPLVKLGVKALKKGLDLNISISSKVSEFTLRSLKSSELSLPSGDFEEISDMDEFMESLPKEGGYDD
jgi:hypothetical protein